jgi:hypothetical protein
MTGRQPPKPPRPSPSGRPDRRALLEAYKDVVKSEADKHGPGRAVAAGNQKRRTALLVTLAVVLVIAFLIRDQWLVSAKLPPETPEVREASLKLVTAKAARRIELYQASHAGALPEPVTLAGDLPTGMSYVPTGSGYYTLTMKEGKDSVTFNSNDSISAFVGNSYDVIRRRHQP